MTIFSMKEVIIATSNSGKIKELQSLLHPISCLSQAQYGVEDVAETGLSFVENAILKARNASSCTGKPALADDSGLVVPALEGEPGIYSARYAGEHSCAAENMALLLKKMTNLFAEQRQAYFYCALALVRYAHDPTPIIATGLLQGEITFTPVGSHGFGYDPIFYLPAYHCTLAEMSLEIKNKLSHRAQALKQLLTL